MDFFDKLGKKASETYKVTAEKTSKMAREAKIRLKMNENKSAINNLYEEIGKKVYEKYNLKEKLDINVDLEEECTKIDVLSAEIESLLDESRNLRDKKQCPKCFEEIEKSVQFCPKCGEKQEDKEEIEIKETENVSVESDTQETENQEENTDDETVKEVTDAEVGVATENAHNEDSEEDNK